MTSSFFTRFTNLITWVRGVWWSPYESLDTDRINWLQENQKTVWRVGHEERVPTTLTDGSTERVQVFDGWAVDDDDSPMPSIRDAIDRAICQSNIKR